MGFLGVFDVVKGHPVPRRIARSEAEFAEICGLRQELGRLAKTTRKRDERVVVQASGGLGGSRKQGQRAELLEAVLGAYSQFLVLLGEGLTVQDDDFPQALERLVDVFELGLLGFFIARNRAHQVGSWVLHTDCCTRESCVREAVFDRLHALRPRADDECSLVLGGKRGQGVHDHLGATRAWLHPNDKRVAPHDVGERDICLFVGVENKAIGVRGFHIGAHDFDGNPRGLDALDGVLVAAERFKEWVLEPGGVLEHVVGDLGKA